MTANQLAVMNLALNALQYAKALRNGEGSVDFYQLLEKDAIDALEEIQASHPITDGEEPFAYWFKDQSREAFSPRSGWFVHCPCDGKLNGQPGIALYKYPPARKPLTEEFNSTTLMSSTSPPQRTWAGLMRGVRVDGDTVVITVKGGDDAARELCVELLKEKNECQ